MARLARRARLVEPASLRMAQPVTIGQEYEFSFPSMPTEHVFEAGHRIGIVVVGTLSGYIAENRGAAITLDTRLSKVSLPLEGGFGAAVASGAIPPPGL